MTWLTQLLLPKSRELWYIPGCPREQPCGWASRPHSPEDETHCSYWLKPRRAQEKEAKQLIVFWSNGTFSTLQAEAIAGTIFPQVLSCLHTFTVTQQRAGLWGKAEKILQWTAFLNSCFIWAVLNRFPIWHQMPEISTVNPGISYGVNVNIAGGNALWRHWMMKSCYVIVTH